MKITTVEGISDYSTYISGYQIVALPDPGEPVSVFLDKGFMPARQDLSLYCMCRQVRVPLQAFSLSSENRRIMRKCEAITYQVVPRDEFEYSPWWREFCKQYTDAKIGQGVVSYERLDSWFGGSTTTHCIVFTNQTTNEPVGLVLLYVEDDKVALYSRSFYDLNYFTSNLGMYQMLTAVTHFAKQNYDFVYLGTCYSERALYKIQFKGVQFFNGFTWTDNMKELKYLIDRDKSTVKENLVIPSKYHENFYDSHELLFDAAKIAWEPHDVGPINA